VRQGGRVREKEERKMKRVMEKVEWEKRRGGVEGTRRACGN
jgi:hypothetical protein